MLFPLLLAAAVQQVPPADVQVVGPGKPNAQTPATLVVEPAAMFIIACDADGDARTTRAELDACVRRSFAAIDTGGTGSLGYIGYGEWQARWLGDQGALPSPFEVDRDGDNRITPDELQSQFGKLFSRYDRNGDRFVIRAEALTIRTTAAGGRGQGNGPPRGKRAQDRPRAERIPGGQPEKEDGQL